MALSRARPAPWSVPQRDRWGTAPILMAALLLGLAGGLAIGRFGPILPILAIAGLVGAALVLVEPRWGLLGALAVIALLPFGTFPVKVGLTPTLLEGALGLTWLVFAVRLLMRRDERFQPTVLDGPIALFLIVTLFALVLGVGRGYTTQTLHDYAKMVLAIASFFLIVNLVRTRDDLRVAFVGLGLGGAAAAILGLALWTLGNGAARFLLKLAIVGYPTSGVIRHVEDDPAKPIRATGTAVDPNSFAGFLMVVLVILIAQVAARRPLVPRALAAVAILPTGLCLLLTQSRAAWVGAAVGVALVGLLRYRWLLIPLLHGVLGARVLGIGGDFARRLLLGLERKDPATKLRLAEYRNALAIIRDHPFFGVGFGAAPSIDQQTGVSSVYLTVAERVGLLGLALFLAILIVLAVRLWPALAARSLRATAESEATLALAGALAASATAGALDHYFFHIGFAHMVALFWSVIGLAIVAARLTEGQRTIVAVAHLQRPVPEETGREG